jgi:hypothetical protein
MHSSLLTKHQRPATEARRAASRLAVLGVAALVGGCAVMDLTDPPSWDLRINIPSKTTSISVGTFLPAGVTIPPDSSTFRVTIAPTTVRQTLGEACGGCTGANGLVIPKPAFTSTQSTSTALPGDVGSAALASGSIAIAIANGFGFDPLAVAGAATSGTMVITVTDGAGRQLAKDSLNGATSSLAGGTTVNRTLALAPGTLRGPITISSTLASPAGGPVTINTAQTFAVTGTLANVAVSSASVTVTNKTVSSSATELDLRDLDSEIRDRLQSAKLLLTVTNPFGVTGALTVRLQGATTNISKALTLATGNSAPTIEFTKSEARSLVGQLLNVTITGPVSAATAVTAAPRDKVSVASRLEITISTESK